MPPPKVLNKFLHLHVGVIMMTGHARVRVPVGVHGGLCMVGVYCIKIFTIIE